jgi:RNA polymerase sigma factor (sigma-70 family)
MRCAEPHQIAATRTGNATALLALLHQSVRDGPAAGRALDRLLLLLYPIVRQALTKQFKWVPARSDFVRDVTQEVLVKVAARYPMLSFSTERAFVGWVLQVARTTGLDCVRTARYGTLAHEVDVQGLPLIDTSFEEPTDGEVHYWSQGLGRLVLEIYEELPDTPAHLMWLRLIVRASWREAGDALGVTAKAAQNRYQRTLQDLRRRVTVRLSALSPDERTVLFARAWAQWGEDGGDFTERSADNASV